MTIRIDDERHAVTPSSPGPDKAGPYVVGLRIYWGEWFAWWDGRKWSKPFRKIDDCAAGRVAGRYLQRYETATWWVDVTYWRYYEDPPRYPSLVPTDDDREAVADALRKAMGM
jgi:hypothetical protein